MGQGKNSERFAVSKFTAFDVFCGCGGLSEGLRLAEFRVIGAVDSDDLAAETYRANHPHVRVWNRDVRKLTGREIRNALNLTSGQLDLLAGCPPCQGFSRLRTANGSRVVRDRMNRLIDEFTRLVAALRPKSIMLENVPGLADKHRFRRFCRRLKRLGYQFGWKILNTVDFGVPQRRRRLILLGSRAGNIDFAPPDETRISVRTAIAGLPQPGWSGDLVHDLPEMRAPRIASLIARVPKNGGSRTTLPAKFQLKCHRDCDGYKDVYGRMAWDRPAPTITGGCCNPSKGRFLHPEENRCITLREAALLQSFRPDYFFSTRRGKFPAAQMIGNALPPEFVRRHAEQVRMHLMRTGGIDAQGRS